MKATLKIRNHNLTVDLSKPIDISIPLSDIKNPLAWYRDKPEIKPVVTGEWVGKVSEGGSVNFNDICINPHAHGTHTESYGHISKEFYSVNQALKTFFFLAKLISVIPEKVGEDLVISKESVENTLGAEIPEAVILRTLPNEESKKIKNWSHSNWPYLDKHAALFLRENGVKHLLIDLPSVDREKDDGKLLAQKAFWNYPENPVHDSTITEMIYVPNAVKDGMYLLNLQITSLENDASPSKPVLYEIL